MTLYDGHLSQMEAKVLVPSKVSLREKNRTQALRRRFVKILIQKELKLYTENCVQLNWIVDMLHYF